MDQKLVTLARKIAELLDARASGALKASAEHYISGLVKAFAILTDETNLVVAMEKAVTLAKQPY